MASKVKTVTVIVEQVSVAMPFLISNFLKPFRRQSTLISLDTEHLKGTRGSPKKIADKLLSELHFFSLGHGVVRIKIAKRRNCLTVVNF